MKRKIVLGSAAAVATAGVLWVGGAFFAGKGVEATLDKQYKWLADQPYFIVKSRSYERGWFSSTESVTLTLNPQIYRFFLEKEGTALPVFEVSYTNRVLHGPFPKIGQFSLLPAKAVVQTEFRFAPEAQKWLSRFFGAQKPVEMENRIGFNNDGEISIKVPGFDYEEAIAGINAKWQGMTMRVDYSEDFSRVKLAAQAPGLAVAAKDVVNFGFNGLDLAVEHARGKAGLMLGETRANLANLTLDLPGEEPLKVELEKLAYVGKLNESGDFLNGEAGINLAKLGLNGTSYGPAEIQAEASHLHGPTLAKLNEEFIKLQKRPLKRDELAGEAVKLAKDHGMPLLTHDPHFGIRKLEVKLPKGMIKFSAGFGIKGFKEQDVEQPVELLRKISAKVDLSVPRENLEILVRGLVRLRFGLDANTAAAADLDDLIWQYIDGEISNLIEQKYINVDGDTLSTTAVFENGKYILNNISVPVPWLEQPKLK